MTDEMRLDFERHLYKNWCKLEKERIARYEGKYEYALTTDGRILARNKVGKGFGPWSKSFEGSPEDADVRFSEYKARPL